MSRTTNVIGIVRVSETKDRPGMMSDADQEERLPEQCQIDGKNLLRIERERDVSGGRPLRKLGLLGRRA